MFKSIPGILTPLGDQKHKRNHLHTNWAGAAWISVKLVTEHKERAHLYLLGTCRLAQALSDWIYLLAVSWHDYSENDNNISVSLPNRYLGCLGWIPDMREGNSTWLCRFPGALRQAKLPQRAQRNSHAPIATGCTHLCSKQTNLRVPSSFCSITPGHESIF